MSITIEHSDKNIHTMFVIKRDGREQKVIFDKISTRIENLCYGLDGNYIDHLSIAQRVIQGIYPGVTTVELDELASQTAAYLAVSHPDFSKLAARICVSNLHKSTKDKFSDVINDLFCYKNEKTGLDYQLIATDVHKVIMDNKDVFDAAIELERDFEYDYFGFKTLEKSYLLKIGGKIVERPQYMLMRVAVGIHKEDIESALETYKAMANRFYTHATPTLFNAGTVKNQLSSCYLLSMKEDSIYGIFETLKQCATISKYSGGIGLSVSNIRASGSYIAGTNGVSNGLIPMLQCYNAVSRFVDQGGKRKGSIAIYIEPWHKDIFAVIDLKKNHGNELERARDLFYALFVNDIFMRRVEANENWTLFCPDETPDLIDLYGEKFDKAYIGYEKQGLGKTIKARDLWGKVLESQQEVGMPYLLMKNACNAKSNQKNLGTIRSSNLCAEVVQYSSKDEIAVCNLASINLLKFVRDDKTYDFDMLHKITKMATRNLNKVIDVNFYPLPETKYSNMKNRPIGIGVQALAETYMTMGLPFESEEASKLNVDIFETIYHATTETSIELAEVEGSYDSYEGSPASEGLLQFDLWGKQMSDERYDWTQLKKNMTVHGLRLSLTISLMPTASSSQFCSGGSASCEPITSNIYNRTCLSGTFPIINKFLINDLVKLGIWDDKMKNKIMASGGSVQEIQEIPEKTRKLYKTAWEISMKTVINQAADRGVFVCQSQSTNVFMARPTVSKLSSYHFLAWRKGLKTSSYYVHSRPVSDVKQFTVKEIPVKLNVVVEEKDDGECLNCSA